MNAHAFWLRLAGMGLSACPVAARHFRYYISGSGEPINVSTDCLLKEDPGLRKHLVTELCRALQQGASCGTLYAPQPIFTNWNWRLALGSITLHWERVNEDILLAFNKTYRWTPCTRRISRPIHRAAHETPGAKSFSILGRPARLPVQSLEHTCPLRKARFLGRLYL